MMCETCGCGSEHGHAVEKVLKVEGMTCQHCVAAIQKSVSQLHGVNYVVVDLGAGTVKVGYDEDEVGLDDIKKKIVEAGYRPVA